MELLVKGCPLSFLCVHSVVAYGNKLDYCGAFVELPSYTHTHTHTPLHTLAHIFVAFKQQSYKDKWIQNWSSSYQLCGDYSVCFCCVVSLKFYAMSMMFQNVFLSICEWKLRKIHFTPQTFLSDFTPTNYTTSKDIMLTHMTTTSMHEGSDIWFGLYKLKKYISSSLAASSFLLLLDR